MTDKPKGHKPFLGEGDQSELDDWDATFDALHAEEPVETTVDAAPLSQARPPVARAAEHVHADANPTLDEPPVGAPGPQLPAELDLDEQLSLDRAEPAPADRWHAAKTEPAVPHRAGESHSALAPFEIEDDPGLASTDDEDVYTSAPRGSEPARASAPVVAARPQPSGPTPVRRGTAAIIRRTPGAMPGVKSTPSQGHAAIPDSDSAFGPDATRVGDVEEIEQRAQQSRTLDARSKAPTAPPPFAFGRELPPEPAAPEEDDYEIEIGSQSEDAAPVATPAVASAPVSRRTVAHVVRRTEPVPLVRLESKPTSPPPVVAEPTGAPGASRAPTRTEEDDFSDVAAAVGASDEIALAIPQDSRADSPVIEIGHEAAHQDFDDSQSGFHDSNSVLDVAEGFDEEAAETRSIDANVAIEGPDAYVQMGSRLEDELDIPIEPPPPSAQPHTLDSDEPAALLGADAAPELPADDHYPGAEPAAFDRPPGLMDVYARVPRLSTPIPAVDEPGDVEPSLDLEAIQLPEQVQPLASSMLDEDAAAALVVYERELATVDESAASAALRIEAGRLCERLGEVDRARAHYDAALLVDPRATSALRGLRRIARSASDLGEATRQLDAELAVAGALERRPLAHYRLDLLLASGDQDLARVAVGELLDQAPSDVRALLAQLELAFLDGRADEFGSALEQLAHAVSDSALRASVQTARALLAQQQNDHAGAASWLATATESDPASIAARLGAVRSQVASNDGEGAARAFADLAQQLEATDPPTAAALAIRAQRWSLGPSGQAAAQLASGAMPADALVARTSAFTIAASGDAVATSAALAAWASCTAVPAERAFAAARAAELDPAHGAELWVAALQADPDDDYAAAQLRTAHVAAEAAQLAIEVDLGIAADLERDRARLRAAFGMIAQGHLEPAIELLQTARTARPHAIAIAEALAEALAAGGRWSERAKLLAEMAGEPGEQLDRGVAQLRSALAWEEAVGAAAEAGLEQDVQRNAVAALEAWDKVLARDPKSPAANAAALALATRLGERELVVDVLARGQAAERSPWGAASLGLRRARLVAEDAARAESILRDTSPALDDPRRTIALVVAAARNQDLADVATALEDRANQLSDVVEAAVLRLRAAQLALDANDAGRAMTLLQRVTTAMPSLGVVRDLLSAARRRAGDRERSGPIAKISEAEAQGAAAGDAFARLVREGDLASVQGDGASAVALFQRALDMRPGDPLAWLPLVRVALASREPAPIAALALARLRAAEAAGDMVAKAEAYELLAHLDRELRGDAGSAQIALESASQADPSRVDLMHRLEREYTVGDQIGELLRLRRAELEQVPADLARDRAAILLDTAGLAERDQRPDAELVELYSAALAADPRHRRSLLHLESIVRRAGASTGLATLEGEIAAYFDGDPRTQAAFYTRAGETLAELGQIEAAVATFGKAAAAHPGHAPALQGWRQAALKGQLWAEVAEAATREADANHDLDARARLHHFAAVVLMDKALNGEQAMVSLRRALQADPAHKDAFLRMRILLEEDANHDELAIVLANRLEHEPETVARTELHRAIAELHRNFLSDRETAKRHYREILAADPNDLRAHAAVADIAWEQGAWQEAADALIARARLEREPDILKTLCFRLGLIYADRLVDVPMALKAFQRALTYNPDDELTLVRLADLATQAGEWKLALGACERLVKAEQDPEKRAPHLHRVARIFRQGFGDAKRAERALNLALDGAPTSDVALEEVIRFYRDSNDMTSVRVHLNRVAGVMRVRAANEPRAGVAYRVIARAMAARASAGVAGSLAVARSAAELAIFLGEGGDPERALLADAGRVDLTQLLKPEADELLYPRTVPTELRQMFALLGDRIAKHVGVDLRAYGVGRGDRLRAKDSAVAQHAQEAAAALGFGEIDVYVSARVPFAMLVEPTSPVSLVLGQAIAQGDARGVRFAAGGALALARASLAIPARLPADELGMLVVALLRLFQPEMPGGGLDEAAIGAQLQKLKRLIPSGVMNELRPYALGIDAARFDHRQLARDIRIAGLRAGLVASGSVLSGLSILAAQAGTDPATFLTNPIAQGLVAFALAEDHAALAR